MLLIALEQVPFWPATNSQFVSLPLSVSRSHHPQHNHHHHLYHRSGVRLSLLLLSLVMSTRHQHAASPTEKQTRMLVSSVFWHQHTTHNTQHSAHSNQVSSIAASQLRGAIFQPDRGSFVCCIPLVIFAVATARSNAICGSRGSPHPIPSHSIPARHPTCLHFNEHNSRIYDEPQPESSISRFLFACFVSELI